MFATASLARRIERAEAGLIAEGAAAARRRLPDGRTFAEPLAGGVAAYTEPDAPFNKVAGLGFEGVPDRRQLEAIEREFADRKSPVQVELASLGDPAVAKLLTGRGYALLGFENVMGLPLDAATLGALRPPAPGIEVAPAGADQTATWLNTVIDGFLHPDTFDGPPSHESFSRDVLERAYADALAAPSFERLIARHGGAVAGGASFRIADGVAQLCGAATRPEHRRRGVQSALLRYRLLDAARRGCDLAVVTTQPGSKSTENVQRAGFALLYVRAILVKQP
jgi:ribosomal protein S18 acetylase RimI-like enzyme